MTSLTLTPINPGSTSLTPITLDPLAVAARFSSVNVIGPLQIAFDDPGLETGIVVYTPGSGEALVGANVVVTEAWDGINPKGDLGTFVGDNNGLYDATGVIIDAIPMTQLPASNGGILIQDPGLSEDGRFYILTADPLLFLVSQDGTNGNTPATVIADQAPALPLTVVVGVNDEFGYMADGVVTETFTVAPGTYTTLGQAVGAMGAAIGESAEAFSAKVTPSNGGGGLVLLTTVGAAGAPFFKAVSFGANDVAAALGFTGNPDYFSGGAGGSPGSTQGAADIYLIVSTPSLT